MIRFCDKMVYCINEGDMTRGEMFSFFLGDKERQTDVILLHSNENGEFLGIITYDTLLFGVEGNKDTCINTKRICAGEAFWDEANDYFAKYPKELLTVVNEAGDVLGFAYFEGDKIEQGFWLVDYIDEADKWGLPILSVLEYQRIKMLVVTDLNEAAWKCKRVFEKEGLKVCVIGEKWEWFGYKSGEGYLDYAEFEKMYLYAEGTNITRRESRGKKVRFNEINSNFVCLEDIFLACTKEIYRKEKVRLSNLRVSICEISIPDSVKKFNRTREEQDYITKGDLRAYDLLLGGRECSQNDCDLLENVLGTEIMAALREKQFERIGLNQASVYKMGETAAKIIKGDGKRKIYLVGPCIVSGRHNLYQETLAYRLQELVADENYSVIAIPVDNWINKGWEWARRNVSLQEGDVIIVINNEGFFAEEAYVKRIDMSYLYGAERTETLFSDIPIHSNAKGNAILAQEIYEKYLKNEIEDLKGKSCNWIQKGEILSQEEIEQVTGYIDEIKHETTGTVGAIVMNCNPFTYGHQYLIEYAAAKVDWLYIFVVEENRSVFSYEDRLELVKKGTEHLSNVIVVPSGKFIVSYETMPIYFEKAKKQEMKVDARLDLEIFARYIAPGLGISKRFVGEEPMDKVTNQYNEQMQEIFELFDLELEVIPRKELGGEVISASGVRKYIAEGTWKQVRELVPETTFEKCRSIFENV